MPGAGVLVRRCVKCDEPIPDDANVCPRCGRDYRPAMLGRAWESENTPLPPIGSALVAVSGLALILSGLLWIFEEFSSMGGDWSTNTTMQAMIGIAAIVAGVFAVSVSPFAITRRRLVLSLAGSIASLSAWGVAISFALGGIEAVLSLVGVVLIALSRDEFVD